MKESLLRITSILLIAGLNWTGLSAVGRTLAFYNDTESSLDNTLTADSLDFSLEYITDWDPSEYALSLFPGDTVSRDVRLQNEGMSGFTYKVMVKETSGDSPLCDELTLDATLEGVSQYAGPLENFSSAEFTHSTSTDDWSFAVSLPEDASYDFQSELCAFSFLFEGGQEGMPFGEGFWDEESLDNTLGSGVWSVVLNEFLPNPDGLEYGFDFGGDNDDMPKGEWVELYNNDTKPHNLSGWYIRDSGDTAFSKIPITELNTNHATSTISGNDWLVVYINKALLNNTSDTVRLFNQHDRLVDSHSYVGNEFCNLEPTPGEENEGDPSGACPGVPGNKSYARIPDGTGGWVDPIPTPGLPNKIEEEAGNGEANTQEDQGQQEHSQEQSQSSAPEEEPLIIEEIVDESESATSTPSYEGDDSDVNEAPLTNNEETVEEDESLEALEEEPVIGEEEEEEAGEEGVNEPEQEQAEEQEREANQEEGESTNTLEGETENTETL